MVNVRLATGYAGDVEPVDAWSILEADPHGQIVDVRTHAEWAYVGVPDLTSVSRELHRVEYQTFPTGAVDPEFAQKAAHLLAQSGAKPETPVLFLCRSGARSRAAAILLTEAGWTRAYNIAGGFEGDLDEERHRGGRNGWKAAGLAWIQS
jgi:rhodanese-related sulfurtransferase